MINIEQIRVARALLDWSTADLARSSGLTINGLNKIERGHVKPQKETLRTLQRIFEENGLAFLPFSGVRKRERLIVVWEGPSACPHLFDDVYEEMRDSGGVVLVAGASDDFDTTALSLEALQSHVQRLRSCGVTEKVLCCEGETQFINPPEQYHCMPRAYFPSETFYIYHSKLAVIVWHPMAQVILIDDALIAESLRGLFTFVWDHTLPPVL